MARTVGDLILAAYREVNGYVASLTASQEAEYLLWANDAVKDIPESDFELTTTFTDPVDSDDIFENGNEYGLVKAKMLDLIEIAREGKGIEDGAGVSFKGGLDSFSTEGIAVSYRDRTKKSKTRYDRALADIVIYGHTAEEIDLYDVDDVDKDDKN